MSTASTYPLAGRSATTVDDVPGWQRAKRDYYLKVLYVVCLAFLAVAMLALLIAFGIYLQQEKDQRQLAHHQRDIHLAQVQQVIQLAQGSGLAWYEYMDVPPACLHSIILREEIEHGLRP